MAAHRFGSAEQYTVMCSGSPSKNNQTALPSF